MMTEVENVSAQMSGYITCSENRKYLNQMESIDFQ